MEIGHKKANQLQNYSMEFVNKIRPVILQSFSVVG